MNPTKINPLELGLTRIAALNLGCKTNRYETDAVIQDFKHQGYDIVSFSDEADIYIINTCSVTGEAGRKSGQMVRRARKRNPKSIVVAMGCHVELGAENLGADILVGNTGKTLIPSLVSKWLEMNPDGLNKERLNYRAIAGSLNQEAVPRFEEFTPQVVQSESRGIIKIQDGCNQFCTYCAIPLARGRVRSRDKAAILKEVSNLSARGFQEMVLTGIHICSYGQDDGDKSSMHLVDLVEDMAKVEGVSRIRLGSLEPKSVTSDFAKGMAAIDSLCPHIHLSLQSGSTNTLKRMNRRYTAEDYRKAVHELRAVLPDMNLTTDIIVGFPGETDADHQESLAFCAEMGFGRIHVFRYSSREGTAASKFKDQVPGDVASKRSKDFQELATKLLASRHEALIGSTADVLLESQHADGSWSGYTAAYDVCRVHFSDDLEVTEGDIWSVNIKASLGEELLAESIKIKIPFRLQKT